MRLFAYSPGPPSPRNYTVWHEIFEVVFRWSPKICSCKIKLSQEHRHRGLLLFLHEWESASCDFLFTHFYYDEESEATPSFTRPISPQKSVRNTKRNAKNLWSAKMKPLRKFRVMRYTFIVQNSNLTILHVVCKTFWAVLYHLSLKISKFLSSLGVFSL